MPNTVLGDASRLIPDLFALQYRDIVQNLLKDLIWQKEIWDQSDP